MRAITLDQANTVITASLARARELDLKPLSVIVLDAGGRVKAFQKQDGSRASHALTILHTNIWIDWTMGSLVGQ